MAAGMIWFLHGAVGLPDDWLPFIEGDGIAVDLYAAVAPFSDWALKFCQRVRECDAAPVLVGYSMGGRLALHALLADRNLWRGALIASAHTGIEDAGARVARLARDQEWAGRARSLPWEDFLDRWNAQPVFARTTRAIGDRSTLEPRREAIADGFDLWSLGRQENLLPALGGIATPVTWVAGARDAGATAVARAAVDALPQGSLEIVDGAGHRVPWDAADRFRAFVRGISG